MAKPRLSTAVTWGRFERAVQAVFVEVLRRLAAFTSLARAEVPLNLEVYWLALQVHQEQLNSKEGSLPFNIDPDSTNKPVPDDSALSPRLKKRPDFACVLKDAQAKDFRKSQVAYYVECKRLGTPELELVFNDLYSEKGILRFLTIEHQYGKGCSSASMIGYIEDMAPDQVLQEVNAFAQARAVPSLTRAAAAWATKNVTRLTQQPLTRAFEATPIRLTHFWIDLRHCTFDIPSSAPPQSAALPAKAKKPKQPTGNAKKAPKKNQ